tara:strand:- start:4160 stop:4591 length:432 start_codon:yes stop_codon:yes gene_type:complete
MNAIDKWYEIMKNKDSDNLAKLDDLLDDDVVFFSPVVHTPQRGKEITKLYLTAAGGVFSSNKDETKSERKESKFKYTKEIISEKHACLEFETEINGIHINGIDLISWNEENKITEFKVLVRPLKAVNTLHELMGKMLEKLKTA